jgi:hypothetical protein
VDAEDLLLIDLSHVLKSGNSMEEKVSTMMILVTHGLIRRMGHGTAWHSFLFFERMDGDFLMEGDFRFFKMWLGGIRWDGHSMEPGICQQQCGFG